MEGSERDTPTTASPSDDIAPERPAEAGSGGPEVASAKDAAGPRTARKDADEPAGDEDAATEAERDEQRDEASSRSAPDDATRYLELAQRAQADFENYKKRVTRDLATAGERAKGGLVRELLPVVDNLERALQSAGQGEQHLADGVRLVHSELLGVLERNGVEAFDPAGDAFDPAIHEALSTRPDADAEAGVVLDVVEKGYKLNGTVLRPARVVVSG